MGVFTQCLDMTNWKWWSDFYSNPQKDQHYVQHFLWQSDKRNRLLLVVYRDTYTVELILSTQKNLGFKLFCIMNCYDIDSHNIICIHSIFLL